MRSHLASLGKDALVYGLANVAMRMVPIVTLPFYTRAFSIADFGLLDLAIVTLALVSQVLDLGLISGSQRSYFDHGDDQDHDRTLVVSTAFLVTIGVSLLAGLLLLLFPATFASLIFDDSTRSGLVVLLGLLVPTAMAAAFFRAVMRLHFQIWRVFFTSVGAAVTAATVGLVAVLAFHTGIEGALAGQLAGYVMGAVFGLWFVRHRLALRFSATHLRTMFAYGLPLIPTALSISVVMFIDRFMIERLSTLNQLGEYAVANRVTQVLPMVLLGFSTAYSPWLLRLWLHDPDTERAVRARIFTYVTILIAFVSLVFALFAREIIWAVAPGYDSAYRAVGLVLVGLGAYGLCSVTAAGMSITRKTWWLMVFTSLGAAVNIALNLVLIPLWGMIGAATATAVAFAFIALLYYVKAQQLYPTPYEIGKVLRVIALTLPLYAIGAIAFADLAVALAIKLAVVALFPVALVAIGVIEWRELRFVRERGRALLSGRAAPADLSDAATGRALRDP